MSQHKILHLLFFLEVIEVGKVSHPVEEQRVEGENFVQQINGKSYSQFLFISHCRHYMVKYCRYGVKRYLINQSIYRIIILSTRTFRLLSFLQKKRSEKQKQTFSGIKGRKYAFPLYMKIDKVIVTGFFFHIAPVFCLHD